MNQNINTKYIKCAGCSKPAELRKKENSFIIPFKGKNGEELCHKCAPCVKCGKEGIGNANSDRLNKYEKTNDNPSGKWVLAHCSIECYNGIEKPSLPKGHPQDKPDNICNWCGKLTWVKFGNTKHDKTFCSRDCFVAAGNEIQKGKCRITGCSREAYYECMDLCLSHSKPCKGGKIKPNGKRCDAAMGTDEGDICEFCQNHNETYRPNPAAPQPITNSDTKSDNQVNPSNSPKPNPGKDNSSEIKITLNTAGSQKNNSDSDSGANENQPSNNKVLVINLKEIKKVSLSDSNLVIEFSQNDREKQTITTEQIVNNRELLAIKNHLQNTRSSSISQQELDKIINSNSNSNSLNPASKKPEPLFWAGISLAGTLMLVGLSFLVVKIKKKSLKKK